MIIWVLGIIVIGNSFIILFTHFFKQVFLEYQLYVRECSRPWQHNKEQNIRKDCTMMYFKTKVVRKMKTRAVRETEKQ